MRPPSFILLLALLSGLAGFAAAGSATAAVTVTYSSTTIGISGVGDNMTFVGFTTTYDPAGTVTIRDGSGVTNASGGACATETLPVLGTTIHCPAATTTVNVTYAAGNDRFMLDGVCIPTTVASLGDGSNSFEQNWTDTCPANTVATVTGGNGSDQIHGGAGADVLNGGGGPDEIRGGAGDDVIDGGDGSDGLSGDDGNDTVLGQGGDDKLQGGGNDLMDGGAGNDVLAMGDPNPGADDLRGGSGSDELWFAEHAPGISVTLDEQANDGASGEGDNVHADFERYVLSPGDDGFAGSPNRELVEGWPGNDVLRGGGGDDELRGDSGDDQLLGEDGADLLVGGSGNDAVDGGPGRDTFFGDDQSCSVYGCAAGADRILARDGDIDAVNCGAGADTAVVDTIDVVAGDGFQACESVDRAGNGAPPGPAPSPPGKQPGPAPFTAAKAIAGKRRFTLRLTLRKAGTVAVKVTRRGARKALGTARYKAKAGRFSRTVTKVRGKRLRRGTYKVVVTVSGTSKTLTVKVR